jgi:hypothetical protein
LNGNRLRFFDDNNHFHARMRFALGKLNTSLPRERSEFMKAITFVAGIAAGMAVTTAAVTAMYPDVSRRLLRDSKKMWRNGRRTAMRLGDMLN